MRRFRPGARRPPISLWRGMPAIRPRIETATTAMREQEAAVRSVRRKAADLVRATGDNTPNDVNYIIPRFILDELPVGLIGLLIVAIILAATDTIAGELNSLSTATVIDFYRRRVRPTAPTITTCAYRRSRPACGVCSPAALRCGRPNWARSSRSSIGSARSSTDRFSVSSSSRWRSRARPEMGRSSAAGRNGLGGLGRVIHSDCLPLAQRRRGCGGRDGGARREPAGLASVTVGPTPSSRN